MSYNYHNNYTPFRDSLLITSIFSILFGSILTSQFWIGEQIVFPHKEKSSYILIPIFALLMFLFTGLGCWLVNDVLINSTCPKVCLRRNRTGNNNNNAKNQDEEQEQDELDTDELLLPVPSSLTIAVSTPSLLFLSIVWMFCSFSRLNEFAICLVVFCCSVVSFFMMMSSNLSWKFYFLKMLSCWISCNIVTAIGTWLSIVLMKMIVLKKQDSNSVFRWSFSSNSLEGVLPLWWPALILLMTTTWGQVCRKVFEM